MGVLSSIKDRLFGQKREDAFFGTVRFAGDHWKGSAHNADGELIEVLMVGPANMQVLDWQRDRYNELLSRFNKIILDAKPFVENLSVKHTEDMLPAVFLNECRLAHVMLPDSSDPKLRGDLTISGPWPGFQRVKKSDDEDEMDDEALITIEMEDWRPVSVELA